ncbi:MAG TPA: hypothetical protein VFL59_15380 [Candidatus Nanopelagicales bacterium]|nr:hypothetical protein [Candidatus Nanopelagicales bacterium]
MTPVLRLVVLCAAVSAILGAGLPAAAATPMSTTTATVRATAATHPADVVVSPDPAHDMYVGTGGLVVPEHDWRSGGGRADAAGCADCQWRVSRLCTKEEFANGGCLAIRIGCPVGYVPVRIWLLRPGQDWAVVGEACQGPRPPITVVDVASAVRDRAVAVLPPLAAGVQPADGTLVSLPAVFRSGQPVGGVRGADLSVLGLAVTLDARARWLWSYGDGTRSWSTAPGGRWPDTSVSHVYRRAASLTATVTAVWRAEFTVEGLGPFAVPGAPLEQQQTLPVVVREARARLVG